MRNSFSSGSGGNQGSSNAMIQSIVPLFGTRAGSSNLLNHPRISSLPPTNQPNMQFGINVMMGNMTDSNFFIPDSTGDSTGLAFRVAYNAAKKYSSNTKELSVCVGSMLCSVVPAFRNNVEAALNGIGIRPRFVSLPSQAHQNSIVIYEVPAVEWSSILVIFGYCILIPFNIHSKLFDSYVGWAGPSLLTKSIDELRTKVQCPHDFKHSGIPFQQPTEISVRTMLGTHALRTSIITFLMENFNHADPLISSLCQYLSYLLSWSGDLRVFTLINDKLVKTKSPVLTDSRVIAEVENLDELLRAIESHTYPQYFNHLCLTSELLHLEVSRFPNLFAVSKVLKNGGDDRLDDYYSLEVSGANRKTVTELVKLHLATLAQNRASTVTRIEPIVEI